MPPEPLPWDWKDFFTEKKHERSEPHHHLHPHPHPIGGGGGGRGFGGVGGFGGGPTWREPLHQHPHPYNYASPRCVSGIRYRPPPGYGKQGGRHLYTEDTSSHGFVPTRPNGKILDDESCQASGPGKYSRNSRENRISLGQKDWKGHSCEAAPSPTGAGRPNYVSDRPRSVDEMLTSNSSNPHSDSANSWDQSHFKDQHERTSSFNATTSPRQKFERENSLGSIDWKPLKWTRSGSLSSRGSGFSHSSSSKNMGADSAEMKAEVQPSNVMPVNSPTGDAAIPAPAPVTACETSAAPSEETSSHKKPRLGWGEGLAKYEKKRVDGIDDTATQNCMVICSSNREPVQLHSLNLADKSPRVTGFSDCASPPATPSSVGCSSSPGLVEFWKAGNVDRDICNLSFLGGVVSQNHIEGSTFNLENLDLAPIAHLNSAINDLLQSDDLTSDDSGFVKSTAINKLLVWKGDVLKALEMTESEIDMLEGELKLISEPQSSCRYPAAPSSLPMDRNLKTSDDQDAASDIIRRPAPLELVLSGDNDLEKVPNEMELEHAEAKDEDVDSPGSATSKFIEVPSLGKKMPPPELGDLNEVLLKTATDESTDLGVKCSGYSLNGDKGDGVCAYSDGPQLRACSSSSQLDGFNLQCDMNEKLYESILASNRECANRAAEVFNKLLPREKCSFDISSASRVSCLDNSPLVKEIFLRRNRFLRFKERAIALKFRAYQHVWKEDIQLLSIRKLRVKSQKKLDLSLHAVHSGHQKHRSSIRSRFSSPAGNLSLIPSKEMVNFVSKLISDSQVKPLRNTLKMPYLILDKKESRFITSNGLVEDPCAVEKERSMINPWTTEEKDIFMDKLTTYGKAFRKIASFLVHKTMGDCIEFYYKNHKSECFRKTKKDPDLAKQGKTHSTNNYLITSGKRWHREANAASLDILGAASAIAASAYNGVEIQQKCGSKCLLGMSRDYKTSKGDAALLERSSSLDVDNNERETVAADVLAGICGSLSSEAMSSCITSSVDPGEGYHEWKYPRVGSLIRWPLTPEVTQNVDDETCSDEGCGEMDPTDWTDAEKSIFIQAVSSYGKDFAMISRCVRTRSRDQCKVFFSKARKCLELDKILPDSGNAVRNDANGGGSDTDDACVVETGSVICSDKSGVKMEGDLPSPGITLNSEPVVAGTVNAKHDLNRTEENNGTGGLEHLDAEPLSKNLIDESLQKARPKQDLDRNGDVQTGPSGESVAAKNEGTLIIPSRIVAEGDFPEGNDHPDTPDIQADSRALGDLDEHLSGDLKGLEPILPERSPDDLKKKVDTNLNTSSGADQGMGSKQQTSTSNPHAADDTDSSTGCGGVSEYKQKVAELESDSAPKPCAIPLQQDNHLVPQVSVSAKCGKSLIGGTPSTFDIENICGEQGSRVGEQHLSGKSLLGNGESYQILGGRVAMVSTTGEMNGESNRKRPVMLQSIPKLDRNFHPYLQKCNGAKQRSSVAELAFQSREQSRDENPSSYSGIEPDAGKPHLNGDVKLFGQILTKPLSQQRPRPSIQQNGENKTQLSNIGSSSDVKSSGDQFVGGNSAQTKLDSNNFVGSGNIPVRSFGFWDGNRIQTGFPSLPDSAMLLAKNPTAFGNYAMPSSKMEQLPLHGVNGCERNLNGASIFPAREIGSSNGATDFQVYGNRELQPFTLDMKQRQEALLLEMQRRNGFDVSTSMQQARGVAGINVVGRGGIVVGGQCTGVSDPVAAIKIHFAQAEQFNGQAGSIIREDDSWRGKGNVGR